MLLFKKRSHTYICPAIHFLLRMVLVGQEIGLFTANFFFYKWKEYSFLKKCLNVFFVCVDFGSLSLHCCAWAFSSYGERGLLVAVVRRLLIAVAFLAAEHGL